MQVTAMHRAKHLTRLLGLLCCMLALPAAGVSTIVSRRRSFHRRVISQPSSQPADDAASAVLSDLYRRTADTAPPEWLQKHRAEDMAAQAAAFTPRDECEQMLLQTQTPKVCFGKSICCPRKSHCLACRSSNSESSYVVGRPGCMVVSSLGQSDAI